MGEHLLDEKGARLDRGEGVWCFDVEEKLTEPIQICLLGSGCIMVSWFDHFRTPAWRPYRALMFVSLGLSGVLLGHLPRGVVYFWSVRKDME